LFPLRDPSSERMSRQYEFGFIWTRRERIMNDNVIQRGFGTWAGSSRRRCGMRMGGSCLGNRAIRPARNRECATGRRCSARRWPRARTSTAKQRISPPSTKTSVLRSTGAGARQGNPPLVLSGRFRSTPELRARQPRDEATLLRQRPAHQRLYTDVAIAPAPALRNATSRQDPLAGPNRMQKDLANGHQRTRGDGDRCHWNARLILSEVEGYGRNLSRWPILSHALSAGPRS
jgi:hypothetical protein